MTDVTVNVNGVEFGGRYRDTHTGFEGVATGVWLKDSGHIEVSLVYLDTVPKSTWVEASRLEPCSDRNAPGIR